MDINCELDWLNQDLLTLATRRLFLSLKGDDEKWRWQVQHNRLRMRYDRLKGLLDPVTRAKYDRLFVMIAGGAGTGVALHLAKHHKFPKNW